MGKKEYDAKYDAKRAGRSKNWATIVYPNSAPADWQEKIAGLKIWALVSPEHKDDVNPDGEPKKPHFHVLMKFSSVKNREQVIELVKEFGGVGAERVSDLRQYGRYLCHLDNPEKAQYNTQDVKTFGGSDYLTLIATTADKYLIIGDILDFCSNNAIYSYRALMDYCRKERQDWFRVLCDNGTYVVKEYLQSAYWEDYKKTWEPLGNQPYPKAPLPEGNPKGEPRQGQSPAQPGAAMQQP